MEDKRIKEYLEGIINTRFDLNRYREFCQPKSIDYLITRAAPLEGYKWLDINTSCFGGGVAVTLSAAIPFFRALGIDADWKVLNGGERFYSITKRMHDALQGMEDSFTDEELAYYEDTVRSFISCLNTDYNGVEVNDFQLIPASEYFTEQQILFWRSHLDTTKPEANLVQFYAQFLENYDYHLFTHPDYLFSQRGTVPAYQVLPTLDPLMEKNRIESKDSAERTLLDERVSLDLDRPIISSCARFDIHKNQIGIVRMFKENRKNFKSFPQLVIMGNSDTMDSPDEYGVYDRLMEEVEGEDDIIVLENQPDNLIGAVLYLSDVFVHLATREGFGMAITEAMWYKTPVVCASTPGIALQVKNNYNGFLLTNMKEAGKSVELLLEDKNLRMRIGNTAKEYIRNNLLTDSFVRRYVEFMRLSQGMDSNNYKYKL